MSRIAKHFHRARMLAVRANTPPETRLFWRRRVRELAGYLIDPTPLTMADIDRAVKSH